MLGGVVLLILAGVSFTISQDYYELHENSGLKLNHTPVASIQSRSLVDCVGNCRYFECCMSGVWNPYRNVGNCLLFDVHFLGETRETEEGSTYFNAKQGKLSLLIMCGFFLCYFSQQRTLWPVTKKKHQLWTLWGRWRRDYSAVCSVDSSMWLLSPDGPTKTTIPRVYI